jgi:uncharacterized small protein (DUF1192 family)
VPERLLVMGAGKEGEGTALSGSNVLSQLLTLLLAEKGGLELTERIGGLEELERYSAELTRKFMTALSEKPEAPSPPPAPAAQPGAMGSQTQTPA